MDLVAEHCANLAKADVDGLMLSWSLGGYPSPNLQVAQRIIGHPDVDPQRVLDDLAATRYGGSAAAHVRKAWTAFSNAMREFPYGLGLYSAPQQVGPANLLYRAPTGYRATMTCYPYDDLSAWCGQYTPEILADQFAKVASGWATGLAHMEQAAAAADSPKQAAAKVDLALAQAAHTYWASARNQVRFILARDSLASSDTPALRAQLIEVLDDEILLAERLFDLAKEDSRIGFEAANQYFYVPLDLVEKVVSYEYLKDRLGMH
jgi:hypothetical protein